MRQGKTNVNTSFFILYRYPQGAEFMSRSMSRGAAGTKLQSLKLKGILLQHMQHEKAASKGG
jgi:hypothetical protein